MRQPKTKTTVATLQLEKQDALTLERVRDILDYNPVTGIFTWKDAKLPGQIAGTLRAFPIRRPTGASYIDKREVICIGNTNYEASRLAWFYVHGKWPKHKIRHANDDNYDNRIANLIEATTTQIALAHPLRRNNTSGFKGVCLYKRTKRWVAYLTVKGKRIHVGCFASPEEAYDAYCEAGYRMLGKDFVPRSAHDPDSGTDGTTL